MNFLWLNISPHAAVNGFASLKLLEFGHSNNFCFMFVQHMNVHQVKKIKDQIIILP